MLSNILHFIAILTTFLLVLAGKLKIATVTFCLALLLTAFTLVGRNEKRRNEKRTRQRKQIKEDSNSELTEVPISKSYSEQYKLAESDKDDISLDNIQIEDRLAKTVSKPLPLLWCWIVLLLGIVTWGTYNFMYRDEPYVPLSRVYEGIVPFSKNTDVVSNIANQEKIPNWSINKPQGKPATTSQQGYESTPIITQNNILPPDQKRKKETPNTINKKGTIYSWTDEKGVTHHSNVAPPAYAERVTTRPEIHSSNSSTPIKLLNGRPLIPITIRHNGRTINFEIIVDTGSSSTLIPNEIANYIKPDFIRKTYSNVADGRRIEGKLMKVDSIVVGPKSVDNIEVISGRVAGSKNKGLLGMNFIKHHPFYMGIEKRQIHWK